MNTGSRRPFAFYLPEDPEHTIVDSALDSVKFLRIVSDCDDEGRLVCRSVDATPNGALARYRGRLMEGVGYCADSVFGAHVLVRFARAIGRPELEQMGFSYLDHALARGFFDDPGVPAFLYRDTETGAFLHNLEARDHYLELGHIARVGYQLLCLASLDTNESRSARCRAIAEQIARWTASTERCRNGWYPRRCTPDGRVYESAPDAFGSIDLPEMELVDPIYDRSGAGAFVLQLLAGTTREGLFEAADVLRDDVRAFIDAGGHFGSMNTDTEDLHENVSYAVAFQALMEASEVLGDPSVRDFAYEHCLAPLERFELTEDLNGIETKGLLYMEDSWNAACTWEMAEAAQAYLVAYTDGGRREHAFKAFTILRGMSRHHHGPHGFLTEAVDWDGHSVITRHVPGQRYGDIMTTHPFLNNLHVVQPTVTYLERFALHGVENETPTLYDMEGNRLCDVPVPFEDWMSA